MNYAFINADGIVVQLIVGLLNAQEQAQFLRDYSQLFNAVAIIEVDANVRVWIGGAYDATDQTFTPPPPEPETPPEVIK
jgi:hypothetical protein